MGAKNNEEHKFSDFFGDSMVFVFDILYAAGFGSNSQFEKKGVGEGFARMSVAGQIFLRKICISAIPGGQTLSSGPFKDGSTARLKRPSPTSKPAKCFKLGIAAVLELNSISGTQNVKICHF